MQWVSLQNANGVPIPLTSISTGSREFVISGGTCGAAVPARVSTTNGMCTVQITFTPSVVGARTATLAIQSGATNAPTVSLAGAGTLVLATGMSAIQFGNMPLALTSSTQTVSLNNASGVPISLASVATGSAEFLITGSTCGTAVPAKVGATNSAVTMSLTGTGTLALATSVSVVDCGNVPVGTASLARSVTLTNVSGMAIPLTDIQTGSREFTVTGNTCGSSVPAKVGSVNGSCTVQLTLTPSTAGSRTGTLTIVSGATNPTATVTLTGSGL